MILALDTTQGSGSIALQDAERIAYCSMFDISITHSETLMPQVDHALRFCGFQPSDIGTVVLCNGPGSFTGLRIGMATAKGIAYGNQAGIAVYDSLLLHAFPRRKCGKNILSVIDARMKEVYAALYDEELGEIIPPQVCMPDELASWETGDAYLVGSGIRLIAPERFVAVPMAEQTAYVPACGLLALHALQQHPVEYDFKVLAELEPLYLRESTAQIRLNAKP